MDARVMSLCLALCVSSEAHLFDLHRLKDQKMEVQLLTKQVEALRRQREREGEVVELRQQVNTLRTAMARMVASRGARPPVAECVADDDLGI
jgi:hypothetical protein